MQMQRIARRAHELSNLIGEDHDLAILAQRAGERRDRFADETAVGELAGLVERRRDELERDAIGLGSRLFRDKPRKLVRPLEQSGIAASPRAACRRRGDGKAALSAWPAASA
jgi:hypothetical protein